MGYDDDVVAFLHDGPRDAMAITIFGSIKSIKNMKRVPSRIPISVDNHHHKRERDSTYRHDRDRAIEYPTRDKDRDRPFLQDIDVRYFKNIKKLTNRIKSSLSCNQQLCPMIKERMEQHQMEKHSSSIKSHGHCCQERDIDSQTVILPTVSRHRTSTKSGCNFNDTHSVQDNINAANNTHYEMRQNINNNLSNTTEWWPRFNNNDTALRTDHNCNKNNNENVLSSIKNNNLNGNATNLRPINNNNNFKNDGSSLKPNNNYYVNNNRSDVSIPLKRTDTRELDKPKRNIYRDYVQKEIKEWIQEVPIYPNNGKNSNFTKENIINILTDKINNLSSEIKTKEYDRKIIMEINNSLSRAPMWYPGAKRDQNIFKNRLNSNLFNRITDLNKKLLVNNTNNNNDTRQISRSSNSFDNFREIEEEITTWLSIIKLKKCSGMQMSVDKQEISKALIKQVAPLLIKPMHTCNFKFTLKCAIIAVLNDLPIDARCSRNRNILVHRFAEDLANKLLSIRAKLEQSNQYTNTHNGLYHTDTFSSNNNNAKYDFEYKVQREINRCLAKTRFAHHDNVKMSISNIIMDYVDSPDEFDVKKEIINVLRSASNISECVASTTAQNIIRGVKSTLTQTNNHEVLNIKPTGTRPISVYTSEQKCFSINYPVTSTPKTKKSENPVPKLNPEEIDYSEKVGNLIRAWMGTLPVQYNAPEEKGFKETIISDLAGEITDVAKLGQMVSLTLGDKENWLKFIVYKWLLKLDVFDIAEVAPQSDDLLKKLKEIPVPVLTRPQHGNRQAMANIKHMETEMGLKEYFVPKGKDILEDGISIWMNEQSSDIFDTDRSTRNNKIQELAEVLHNKLTNKRPETEISNYVEQWLNNIVKLEQKTKIGELTDNLKSRVVNLPQDATLVANRDKRVQQRADYLEEMSKSYCQPVKIKTTNNDTVNLDKTMKQFIAKFIEHNYDVDDPMARGAFSHLLKTKLQRLNPPTRKEVYDNFAKSEIDDQLCRAKLIKELDYIKDISDWLKNIPIDASYNTVGNRDRIDFVNDLAKNILDLEEEREDEPEAMDYNMYMASIIFQFLIQLPLIKEYKTENNMNFMMDQLIGKVIVHRIKNLKESHSIDTSGVHNENVGDFIEEFIRVNGREIANDEVKLEAWSVRLLKEIKKMVRENADPAVLSKAHVYNRLTNVPQPGDESIKQFDDEFEYIKEISEWLKNLPLLPIDKTDEDERIRMTCELTEKITERENEKLNNPNNATAEAEFSKYVSKWISDLSLDESREVVVTVVIQQLINRIERVKARQEKPNLIFTQTKETKSAEKNDPNLCKKHSKTSKIGKSKQIKNPAGAIVNSIEKWSASLPIKADDEKSVKSIKDYASKKLFQTVGELSIDPITFNDDLLYQDILADEVDAVIEKLPQNPELQKNKDKLRNDLVQNIVEAQKAIKENGAGEYYKQKLEHTIEASIPHPVKARQEYDPGFEIYKSRLADIFILENFDHANDAVKIKYERKIKDAIDKYYDSVKNKNAIPLTNDEIYTELYSVLFKVPIPNESSVIGEVEEIKTRCEIDIWFENLPLKEADDLTELLEHDKILATLAKRIHEIEKIESKPADKIYKEIMKWLVKLPLLPGQGINVEQYAKKLQETLKLSADQRKCITTEPKSAKSKKSKTKLRSKDKIKVNKDDSQIPEFSTDSRIPIKPKKKPAEIIIEIVEAWCNQLPVYATTPEEEGNAKMLRENLSTKIIIKISEINMNPVTFNDDFQYDDILDQELDKLLSVIPTCCNFKKSKTARKTQLKDAVKSVKPLFREEKAKHQYKQNLDQTIAKVLGKPQDATVSKETLFKNLKEEIVENFVQFNYDKEDDEGRQAYKTKVHDAIVKFLTNVVENKDETMDPLMRRNQLMCELAKIPIPNEDSFKEIVEEIRMKNEISVLFDDLAISDNGKDKSKLVNQVKSSLAKKLNDIELNGYSPESEAKMKNEVAKNLKKLNKEVKPDVINDFIRKLKCNEIVRRAPKKVKTDNTCQKDCIMGQICGKKTPLADNASKPENLDDSFKSKNISQNNTVIDTRTCLEHCHYQNNSQKSTTHENTESKKQLSFSNTHVECECSKYYGNSKTQDFSPTKQKSESKIYAECECPKYFGNSKTKDFSPTKQKSQSKINVECECMEHSQKSKSHEYSPSRQKSVTKTHVHCEHENHQNQTPAENSPSRQDLSENGMLPEGQEESSQETDEDRCICGAMRRPCYMPMGWYCNGPYDMPICMPAGFYYY